MISIIIPFRDKVDYLSKCLNSISKKTSYEKYEVLLVNNQSISKDTSHFLDSLNDPRIRILQYDQPFNFSDINNYAVKFSKGDYLLFLNNDVEVITIDWLSKMLSCFNDEKVGVAGSNLLYKNNSVQHCGVMLEKDKLAIHAFRRRKVRLLPIQGVKEWRAVTGACMMTKKDLFSAAGGFDGSKFPIAYNDIDYCLKIRKMGYKTVCNLDVKLYHYESASRGRDIFAKYLNRKRYKQFMNEQNNLKVKWEDELASDPFYEEAYR